MTTSIMHENLANMVLLYYLVISIWGYIRFFGKKGIDDSYRGALVIAEGLMVLQMALGGFLWLSGFRPGRTIHLLYGALLPVMIPLVYMRTEGRDGRPEILMYATVLLFTVGLTFRANFTGELFIP